MGFQSICLFPVPACSAPSPPGRLQLCWHHPSGRRCQLSRKMIQNMCPARRRRAVATERIVPVSYSIFPNSCHIFALRKLRILPYPGSYPGPCSVKMGLYLWSHTACLSRVTQLLGESQWDFLLLSAVVGWFCSGTDNHLQSHVWFVTLYLSDHHLPTWGALCTPLTTCFLVRLHGLWSSCILHNS